MSTRIVPALFVAAFAFAQPAHADPFFKELPNVPGTPRFLSGNGNTIVGAASNRAFWYFVDTDTSVLGDSFTAPMGASADGTAVYYSSTFGDRWENGVSRKINNRSGTGISDDGTIILQSDAYVVGTAVIPLSTATGNYRAQTRAFSGDGTVIVGEERTGSGFLTQTFPVRWDNGTPHRFTDLGAQGGAA